MTDVLRPACSAKEAVSVLLKIFQFGEHLE
jgi:hypothetical protein